MRLALFDFDGTLTTSSSLLPFLRKAVGTPHWLLGVLLHLPLLLAYLLGLRSVEQIKLRLLSWFLNGRSAAELAVAGQLFAHEQLPRMQRSAMMEALHQHQAQGDVCLVVSAALGCYLRPWGRAHGIDAVLCTELEEQNGLLTGALRGPHCSGPNKVARVNVWLAGRVPSHITAYGDSAGDADMLALAHTAHYQPWRKAGKVGKASPASNARSARHDRNAGDAV